MDKAKIEIMLFDLDGTLVDSRNDIVTAVNLALDSCGEPTYSFEQVSLCIGRGIRNLFRSLLAKNHPDENKIDALVNAFRSFYSAHMEDSTTVFPGIFKVLEYYSKVPKAVITNKSQASADEVVDLMRLRPYFEGVFGADAFPTQKPDPGPILAICERWRRVREKTVIIGDTAVDMKAGKSAGVITVAALYGYGDKKEIAEMAPDFQIESPGELLGLFEQN
jgi:phosphoglycolate phosphatase